MPVLTRTIITASGTYNPPDHCLVIFVECIGGGGAGGGTPATNASGTGQCAAGGGGRGGSYAASLIQSPSASYSVTIGAGGTGAAGAAGGNGGDTVFGSNVIIAGGGKGAPVAVADVGSFPDTSGAVGGSNNASTGDMVINGGIAGGGNMLTDAIPVAGVGGPAPKFSTTVQSGPVAVTSAGKSPTVFGTTYGNGGTGATAIAGAAAQAGGNGAAGVIVVWEIQPPPYMSY